VVFDAEILDVIQEAATIAMEVSQDAGVQFSARHNVSIVNQITSTTSKRFGFSSDSQAQTEKQWDVKEMYPQPIVKIKDQMRNIDGIVTNTGDALLQNISLQYYSREDFVNSTFILVGGDIYDVVKGSVTEQSSGVFLECKLKRSEQKWGDVYGS